MPTCIANKNKHCLLTLMQAPKSHGSCKKAPNHIKFNLEAKQARERNTRSILAIAY